MDIKGLKVFRIFLNDKHDKTKIESYLSVAICAERAIGITKMHAEKNGWKEYEVDQATCLGELSILDLQYFGECEVAKCQ